MLMKSTVRSQRLPGLVTPGATQMNGARVASSHRANLRQWCFSPRCQPWSPQKQMIEIVFAIGRQLDLFQRIHVIILTGNIPGHVWLMESDGEEERFVMLLLKLR